METITETTNCSTDVQPDPVSVDEGLLDVFGRDAEFSDVLRKTAIQSNEVSIFIIEKNPTRI